MIKSKPHLVFTGALLLVILAFYGVAAVRFPLVYIWATYEDLIGEWIQFWSVMVAMGVSLLLAAKRWRYRWFFLMLALSCFYVAMEEISWGQRLLGFRSPEFFRANNLQGEINLHNFFTGPYSTSLKAGITYVLACGLGAYGLVYPVALRWRWKWAVWMEARGLAAPPLYLWPYFVVGAILEWGLFRFNEAEIAEMLIGLGLAFTTVHYRFFQRHNHDIHDGGSLHAGLSRGLSVRLLCTTVLILLLSLGTTLGVYATPSGRARIHRRLDNGVEKFAGRYTNYHRWRTAADLYLRVHAREPRRVSILRKIADCYLEADDLARFDFYIRQALAIDLERDRRNPGRASVNRSLARTYRIMGEEEKAEERLDRALQIGLRRIKENSWSAAAAYSLGKTYSLMDRPAAALLQLSKAYQLKPTSKRYRKAYYSAKRRAE